MPKVRVVTECRWVEDGWPVADGDGVYIVSISGGVEYRARVSWHQFIKYHMEAERLIAAHLDRNNVEKFPSAAADRASARFNAGHM